MSDRVLYIQTPSLAKTPVGEAQESPDLSGYALSANVHNLPSGGTAGQFLVKSSGTDYDAAWVTVPNANGVSF